MPQPLPGLNTIVTVFARSRAIAVSGASSRASGGWDPDDSRLIADGGGDFDRFPAASNRQSNWPAPVSDRGQRTGRFSLDPVQRIKGVTL